MGEKATVNPKEQLKNANGPIRELMNDALRRNYEDLRGLSESIRQDELKEHAELEKLQKAILDQVNISQFTGASFRFFYTKPNGERKEPTVKLYALGHHYTLGQDDHRTLGAHISSSKHTHLMREMAYQLRWMGNSGVPALIYPGQASPYPVSRLEYIDSLVNFELKTIVVSGGEAFIVEDLPRIASNIAVRAVSNGYFPRQDGLPWLFGVTENTSTRKGIFLINAKGVYRTDLTRKLTRTMELAESVDLKSAAYFQPITLNPIDHNRVAVVLAEPYGIKVALPTKAPLPVIRREGADSELFHFPAPISYFRDFTISFMLFFKHNGAQDDLIIIGGLRHLEIVYRPQNKALVIRWNTSQLKSYYERKEIVLENALNGSDNSWSTIDITCKNRKLTVYIKGKQVYKDLVIPEAPPQAPLYPNADQFILGPNTNKSSVILSLMELRFFQRAVENYELLQNATGPLTTGDYGFPDDLRAVYPLGPLNSPIYINASNSGIASDFMNRVNPNEFIHVGKTKLVTLSHGDYVDHPFMNSYTIASDQNIQSDVLLCNRSGMVFYMAINDSTQCIMMQDIYGTKPAVIVAKITGSTDIAFQYDGVTTEWLEEALNRKRTVLRLAHFKLERAREDAHLVIHHEMNYLEQEIKKAEENAENVAVFRKQYNTERQNWEALRPQSLDKQYKAIDASMKTLKTARLKAHDVLHEADIQINTLRMRPSDG